MEGFKGELKKYKNTIDYLQRENAELAEEAAANKTGTMEHRMEVATLQSRLNYFERFQAALPEQARREAEAAMKHSTKDKTR